MDAGYLHLRSGQGYCGPGSTQGYARNRAGLYVRGDEGVVTTFRADLNKSGQAYLPPHLDIAGTRVWPTFLYTADQAAAGTWTATVGEDLTIAGGGTDPDLDQGSPFGVGGGADTGVFFDVGEDYYEAASATSYDVTTGHLVVEAIVRNPATSVTRPFLDKRSGNGWQLRTDTTAGRIQLLCISGTNTQAPTPTMAIDSWVHVFSIVNRDRNANDGAATFGNGVLGTQAWNPSTLGSLTSAKKFTIGEFDGVGSGHIAYAAMWEPADLGGDVDKTTEWTTIAQTRYAQLFGIYPQIARGTALPTVMTRASAAYLRRDDASPVLYYVGAGHMRVEDWTTDNGYHAEPASTNRLLQSKDHDVTWTARGATTVTADNAVGPAGATDASTISALNAKSTDDFFQLTTGHGADENLAPGIWIKRVSTSGNLRIAQAFSGEAKGQWDVDMSGLPDAWVRLTRSSAYVSVANEFVAATGGQAGLQFWATSGGPLSFDLWNCQLEAGVEATSDIVTGAAAATRVADSLRYKGDDGNCKQTPGYTVSANCLLPNADLSASQPTLVMLAKDASDRAHLYEASDGKATWYSQKSGGNSGLSQAATGLDDGAVHVLAGHARTNNHYAKLDGTAAAADTSVDPVEDVATILVGEHIGAAARAGFGLISNVEIKDRD